MDKEDGHSNAVSDIFLKRTLRQSCSYKPECNWDTNFQLDSGIWANTVYETVILALGKTQQNSGH